MSNLVNLDRMTEPVRKVVAPYCQRMVDLHGQNLRSIFMYGSAAADEFIPKRSNVNILVVLDRIDPPDLKKSLKLIASGRKKRVVAPLMLTTEHVRRSTDAFPIEFLEMKENHILLYGQDILKDLVISPDNIRLQCEQQLKGGLVRLYQSYLEAGKKKRQLRSLMASSLTGLIPTFRNLLRLKGRTPSTRKREVIQGLSDEFDLNIDIFLRILEIKGGLKFAGDLEALFGDYLEEIEKLGILVDRMEV